MSFQVLRKKLSDRIADASSVTLHEIDSVIRDLLYQGQGESFLGFSEMLTPQEADLFFSRADFASQAEKKGRKVITPFLVHFVAEPDDKYGVIRLSEEAADAVRDLLLHTFLAHEETMVYPFALPLAYLASLSFEEVFKVSYKAISQRDYDKVAQPLDWLKFMEIPPLTTRPDIEAGEEHPYVVMGVVASTRTRVLGHCEGLPPSPSISFSKTFKEVMPLCIGTGLMDSLDYGTFLYKEHVLVKELSNIGQYIALDQCNLEAILREEEVGFEIFQEGDSRLTFNWQRSYFEQDELMEDLVDSLALRFKFQSVKIKNKEETEEVCDILPVSAQILPFLKR